MKLFSFFLLVSSVAITEACSTTASDSATSGANCVGPNCGDYSGSKDNYDLDLGTGSGGTTSAVSSPTASESNSCGLFAVGCNPDDDTSCAHAVPNVSVSSGGTSAVSGSESGAGAVSGGGTSSLSTGSSTGITVGTTTLACRIVYDNSVPLSQCEVAGVGTTGAPCVSRADCAPGFACADDNGTAQCRHYCCGGSEGCPTGTYCDDRLVREISNATITLTVPVCMPAVACRFDDPYPCPAEQTCSCPSGRICGVVRADGTTACVEPGTGLEGDLCGDENHCAAGHVCSAALGTCVKTCSLLNAADSAEQCTQGVCQSSTSLPADVGICVSSATLN